MKLVNKIMFVWVIVFFVLLFSVIMTNDPAAIKSLLLMLMLLGGVMCIDQLKDLLFCFKSKNWPTTPSIIKNSRISRSHTTGKHDRNFTPYFIVEYIVNEQLYQYEFKNQNPSFFNSEEKAQAYVNEVEAGKIFGKIYYNPLQPQLSNIEPGLKVQHILGIPMSFALIIIPLLSLAGIINW